MKLSSLVLCYLFVFLKALSMYWILCVCVCMWSFLKFFSSQPVLSYESFEDAVFWDVVFHLRSRLSCSTFIWCFHFSPDIFSISSRMNCAPTQYFSAHGGGGPSQSCLLCVVQPLVSCLIYKEKCSSHRIPCCRCLQERCCSSRVLIFPGNDLSQALLCGNILHFHELR